MFHLSSPKEFIGKNKVESLNVNKIELGEADETGRRKPVINENEIFKIEADLVIKALGFDPENLPRLFGKEDLQVSQWGTIKVDFNTLETSVPGVFAAGDIVRGASLVVWAIKDGRDAASQIEKYLRSKSEKSFKAA